jgi:hypothetical protein
MRLIAIADRIAGGRSVKVAKHRADLFVGRIFD